jgi:broad specificity phosphatase PhoE
MTTTLLLVRHAAHDLLGRVLTGRMGGVGLSEEGRGQAARLAAHLVGEPLAALYTSPLERTRETAAALAERLDLKPAILEGVAEVDYGDWTGMSFADLGRDPRWAEWNGSKSTLRPPGGESLLEVQSRAVGALECVRAAHPDCAVAVVSHGDVIKAALAHYLGLPLEGIARLEVSPASLSTVAVGPWGAKVHAINQVARP